MLFSFVNKLVVIILLVLLILSFSVWGIADVMQGGGDREIANVNGVSVSEQEYSSRVNGQLRQLASIYKMTIDDGTRTLVETRTLSEMINYELMKQYAADLGIAIGTQQAVADIRDTMDFISGGEFDKDAFEGRLRAMGMSEYGYIEDEVKPALAEKMIENIFLQQPLITSTVKNIVHQYEGERRIIQTLTIPAAVSDNAVLKPTDEELQAFYDENAAAFFTPDYRKISFVELNKASVQEQIGVTEDALRAAYENRKEEFSTAQERAILQMSFNTQQEAQDAKARVDAGEPFVDVAKDLGVSDASLNALGRIEVSDVAQNQFYPDELADAVFGAQKGDVTPPMKSALGWHIYKVNDIFPGKVAPFEEAKERLQREIETEFAEELIYDLSNQVEDALAGGANLEEMAQQLDLSIQVIDAMDNFGLDSDGKAIENLPAYGDFTRLAFEYNTGQTSPMLISPDGLAYAILRVDGVTERRQQSLDEVREDVTARYIASQKRTVVAKKANDIFQAIKAGSTLEEQAQRLGVEIEESKPLYRKRVADSVNELLRGDIFGLQVGEYAGPARNPDGSYVIAKLTEILPALENDEVLSMASVEEKMLEEYEENIRNQLITALQQRYPVRYNVNASPLFGR